MVCKDGITAAHTPTCVRCARRPVLADSWTHTVQFAATVPRCCGNPLKPLPVTPSAAGSCFSRFSSFFYFTHGYDIRSLIDRQSLYPCIPSICVRICCRLILTFYSPPPGSPPPRPLGSVLSSFSTTCRCVF